jgi:hypothetical protein
MTRNAFAASLLLTALALAGCAGDPDLFKGQSGLVQRYDGDLTFEPPVATNATGALVDVPQWAIDPATAPRVVEQMVGRGGAEPNIGITSSGALFVNTFDQTQRSTDHGKTWETVYDYLSPGAPTTEDLFSTKDPMLWVDPDTDRVFVSQMNSLVVGFCTNLAISDDDGATWIERPVACGMPHIDHQKVMTAHYGPGVAAPPEAARPYPNVVYMCTNNQDFGTWCTESFNGGLDWSVQQQVSPEDLTCANINGHPVAWPDGTVAMPMGGGLGGAECTRSPTVYITETNGLGGPAITYAGAATPQLLPGWNVRTCAPDLVQREIDPDLTVTPDGTAYMMFRGDDQLHYLLRSTDKFQTCDVFKVSPPDITLGVFAGITSGADGKVAMTWLGTKSAQDYGATPSNATGGSIWHAYTTFVMDAESADPTFVHFQVTPREDPVQVGCVWLGGGAGGPQECRNLLDFIDMVAGPDGRTYTAITDGCTPRNGCSGDTMSIGYQSRDRQIAVFVLDAGLGLQGQVLPTVGLVAPQPFPE